MPDNPPPQHFRVPREDRSLLRIPELTKASRLVEENRRLFDRVDCVLHGRSLNELRAAARASAIAAATEYTASLLNHPLPVFSVDSCVLSGHQPELFHVGVWAKNFALAGIARRCRSIPLNLVIDNDTLNSTSIRLPQGPKAELRIERIPFDVPRSPAPWEEAVVIEPKTFEQFGSVIGRQIRDAWGFAPLIESNWSAAVEAWKRTGRLCDALTGLRARLEHNWGLSNLELPMSRLCETPPFLWFVAHLLMRLPEFHQIYNQSVAEYRREHRLRNRMQPVPDLETQGEWLEAPFWIWQSGDMDRGRLFVRRVGDTCELKYRDRHFATLPFVATGSLDAAVAVLSELPSKGIRLRTRALTTTLFARTCLADLFVHGIGGAKYDAMTDQICERFFGFKAPSFLTASATLYLPLGDQYQATRQQLQLLNHQRRDVGYNPDRYLQNWPQGTELIAEKEQILAAARQMRATGQLRGHLTQSQHQRLSEIRSALLEPAQSIRQGYENDVRQMQSQLASNDLLRNREYAFPLYPENLLREFLLPLAQG